MSTEKFLKLFRQKAKERTWTFNGIAIRTADVCAACPLTVAFGKHWGTPEVQKLAGKAWDAVIASADGQSRYNNPLRKQLLRICGLKEPA